MFLSSGVYQSLQSSAYNHWVDEKICISTWNMIHPFWDSLQTVSTIPTWCAEEEYWFCLSQPMVCSHYYVTNLKGLRMGQVFFFQCWSLIRLSHKLKKHGYIVYQLCCQRRKLTVFISTHITHYCSLNASLLRTNMTESNSSLIFV